MPDKIDLRFHTRYNEKMQEGIDLKVKAYIYDIHNSPNVEDEMDMYSRVHKKVTKQLQINTEIYGDLRRIVEHIRYHRLQDDLLDIKNLRKTEAYKNTHGKYPPELTEYNMYLDEYRISKKTSNTDSYGSDQYQTSKLENETIRDYVKFRREERRWGVGGFKCLRWLLCYR
jgi:hypothetical protein